jgi:hypothetical protein
MECIFGHLGYRKAGMTRGPGCGGCLFVTIRVFFAAPGAERPGFDSGEEGVAGRNRSTRAPAASKEIE